MRLRFGNLGARFWAGGFLRNCRREMKPVVADVRAVDTDIRREAQALFDAGIQEPHTTWLKATH